MMDPEEEEWSYFEFDLCNLRLARREFCYSLRPLLYESIYLPKYQHEDFANLSPTGSVRELLLLIDRDPRISAAYDKTCIPMLLSKLQNLRSLTYNGHPGGKTSFLLTPSAKKIWTWMPLKSLHVLKWRPQAEWYARAGEIESDEYCTKINGWDGHR
ncbi:hypothetical protein FPQ18DRAFT_322420 [Pyronema domesticum]|nr:hypothetical protein FPQ18DRAFT_322420 [Pyronema domesticum]